MSLRSGCWAHVYDPSLDWKQKKKSLKKLKRNDYKYFQEQYKQEAFQQLGYIVFTPGEIEFQCILVSFNYLPDTAQSHPRKEFQLMYCPDQIGLWACL